MEEKQYDFKPKTWVSFVILLILIGLLMATGMMNRLLIFLS